MAHKLLDILRKVKGLVSGRIGYYNARRRYGHLLPRIMDDEATLDHLLATDCSMSRYGDGEMHAILCHSDNFATADERLSKRLKEILVSNLDNHIVCLPYSLITTDLYTWKVNTFWHSHLGRNMNKWAEHTQRDKIYYNTAVSRFYMDYKDKSSKREYAERLKQIWEGKDILIIEGVASRMGVGNDLFDGARSVERILCPPTNAFAKYDRILDAARRHGKGKLIIIALGQTATVLAYDLALEGFRALDIGHVDIEYEWMLRGAARKTPIANKYVNEVPGEGRTVTDYSDQKYDSQIIETIL